MDVGFTQVARVDGNNSSAGLRDTEVRVPSSEGKVIVRALLRAARQW